MCGIAGFFGVNDPKLRLALVKNLGIGIDSRGNAMAGFVAHDRDGGIHAHRKCGGWHHAVSNEMDFINKAAAYDAVMMHSRAPGAYDPVTNAHPFPITRDDRIVLWGAHNGSLNEAYTSAAAHNRKVTVDSQELFELIADREYDLLNTMHGWGVAEWVETDQFRTVNLSRLTIHSDLVVANVNLPNQEKAIMWASTKHILRTALFDLDAEIESFISCEEIGRVYQISDAGVMPTDNNRVRFAIYGDEF